MPTIATAKATSTVASGHQTAAIAVVPLDQNLRMSRKRPQRGGQAEAAENDGPMIFARIGMMQAINRHKPVEFDPKRKSPHWGKRKLRRDE